MTIHVPPVHLSLLTAAVVEPSVPPPFSPLSLHPQLSRSSTWQKVSNNYQISLNALINDQYTLDLKMVQVVEMNMDGSFDLETQSFGTYTKNKRIQNSS